MAIRELPKELGDLKGIRRDFKQVASDERYLNSRWDELVQSHRDEWVAVYRHEMIFSKDLENLFQLAASKEWDLGTMVVDYLIPERRRVLLRSW